MAAGRRRERSQAQANHAGSSERHVAARPACDRLAEPRVPHPLAAPADRLGGAARRLRRHRVLERSKESALPYAPLYLQSIASICFTTELEKQQELPVTHIGRQEDIT